MATDVALPHTWTLYYSNLSVIPKQQQGDTAQFLTAFQKVFQTNSVQHFLDCYQFLAQPEMLTSGQAYSFCRENIMPMYEDPNLHNGRRIKITLTSGRTTHAWEHLLMHFFAGSIDRADVIAAIEVRRGSADFICLWTQACTDDVIDAVKGSLKKIFNLPETFDLSTFGFNTYHVNAP